MATLEFYLLLLARIRHILCGNLLMIYRKIGLLNYNLRPKAKPDTGNGLNFCQSRLISMAIFTFPWFSSGKQLSVLNGFYQSSNLLSRMIEAFRPLSARSLHELVIWPS